MSIKKVDFYVCIGGNGIYYTLRKITQKSTSTFMEDVFVKNLSVDSKRAIDTAQNFITEFKSKVDGAFDITFDPTPRQSITNTWGDGKIPAERLTMIRTVNTGVMPYGMHKGKNFEDIPSDYLAWACAEACKKNDPVTINVGSAAFCILMERGEVKQFSDIENLLMPKINANLKSRFYGEINQRVDIKAKIEFHKKEHNFKYQRDTHFYKLRFGDDILIYTGSVYLGEIQDTVEFKATIEKHTHFHNIQSTHIKRPHLSR